MNDNMEGKIFHHCVTDQSFLVSCQGLYFGAGTWFAAWEMTCYLLNPKFTESLQEPVTLLYPGADESTVFP